MLLAYADDSGSEAADKRLFLAAYIMTPEAWHAFNLDWRAALAAPRALTSLHMTRSFKGWSEAQRRDKLQRLAEVIGKYEPLSVEVSVSRKDFKDILLPHAPYDLRHPYFICFHTLLVQAARLADHFSLPGRIDFVFDNQGNVGNEAAVWYEPMRQMHEPAIRDRLGPVPVFRSDEEVAGLQAADMLAWSRRVLVEPFCTDGHREFAESLVFRHAVAQIPREMLEGWAKGFAAVPGIEEVKGKRGSVHKSVSGIVQSLPPERLVPAFEALERRAFWMRRVKALLQAAGLQRVWRWFSKRGVRIR